MHNDYKSFIPLENLLVNANKNRESQRMKQQQIMSKSIHDADFHKMLANDFLSSKSANKGKYSKPPK